MQVEVINYDSVKHIDFIDVYICEARYSMQYRSPNGTIDSCCQQCIILFSPLGGSTCPKLLTIH